MKNIRRILFLGCILLNTTSSILNAMDYDDNATAVENVLKFENDPTRAYEALADYLLKTIGADEINIPVLKNGLLLHKEKINITIETFKKMPVELRKTIYKAACGTKVAVAKIKQDFLNNIKAHKAIIADYDKKAKELASLNKKTKKTEKDAKNQLTLTHELAKKENDYNASVRKLTEIEKQYSEIDFNAFEQWINKIKSVAYWNSGSGFFEQFWNLNWSGKALTFVGTPLACYGAYKLYNDYQSAQDEDTVDGVKDSAQNIKNTEIAKVVAPKKLR